MDYMAAKKKKKKAPKRDTSNWAEEVKARAPTRQDIQDRKVFGKALTDIQKSRRLTDNGLAKLLGTSRSQITRIRNGETEPRLSLALKWAKALKIPLYRFWDGKPSDTGRGPTEQQWAFLDLYEQLSKSDRELLMRFVGSILQGHAERLGIK